MVATFIKTLWYTLFWAQSAIGFKDLCKGSLVEMKMHHVCLKYAHQFSKLSSESAFASSPAGIIGRLAIWWSVPHGFMLGAEGKNTNKKPGWLSKVKREKAMLKGLKGYCGFSASSSTQL